MSTLRLQGIHKNLFIRKKCPGRAELFPAFFKLPSEKNFSSSKLNLVWKMRLSKKAFHKHKTNWLVLMLRCEIKWGKTDWIFIWKLLGDPINKLNVKIWWKTFIKYKYLQLKNRVVFLQEEKTEKYFFRLHHLNIHLCFLFSLSNHLFNQN